MENKEIIKQLAKTEAFLTASLNEVSKTRKMLEGVSTPSNARKGTKLSAAVIARKELKMKKVS